MSLVSDRGGQSTPVAAATWFVVHGGAVGDLPRSGWHQDGQDSAGVIVRSQGSTLHAVQGPDLTWQIDSGTRC